MTSYPNLTPLNIDSDIVSNIDSDIDSDIDNLYLANNEGGIENSLVQKIESLNLTPFMNEGIRFKYFIPYINKRGWGVVYMRFRIGDSVYRISTHLKVNKECWKDGEIILNRDITRLEYVVHLNVKIKLKVLKGLVSEKILCNYALGGDYASIIKDIKKLTMSTKNKEKQMVTLLLKKIADRHTDRESTKEAYYSKVDVLKRFFKEFKIEDDLESINQTNLRKFRDYLAENTKATTAKQTLGVITYLLKTLQQEDDSIRFTINPTLLPPIKDKTTKEEKRNSHIALTHDEIQRFKELENLNDKQKKCRDLFVIECQAGIRFEDFPRLLNSKNHVVKEGITYAVLDTEKKGVQGSIPLDAPQLYPDTLELMKPYLDDREILSMKNSKDTKTLRRKVRYCIKKLARDLGMTREIVETSTIKGKKVQTSKRLCDKISCHDGRRSFITNCIRVFKLIPSQIIGMSAHSNTKMIEEIYAILTKEDKLNSVANTIENLGLKTVKEDSTKDLVKNRGVEDKREGLRVLEFLGVEVNPNLTFEEIVNLIKDREGELIDTYGVSIDLLKVLFNVHKSKELRINALNAILKVFKD